MALRHAFRKVDRDVDGSDRVAARVLERAPCVARLYHHRSGLHGHRHLVGLELCAALLSAQWPVGEAIAAYLRDVVEILPVEFQRQRVEPGEGEKGLLHLGAVVAPGHYGSQQVEEPAVGVAQREVIVVDAQQELDGDSLDELTQVVAVIGVDCLAARLYIHLEHPLQRRGEHGEEMLVASV